MRETTREQAIERLSKLHHLLKNIRTELPKLALFDMSAWAGTDRDADEDTPLANVLREDTCGTAACAAGSAGLHPWFREQGLKTSAKNATIKFRGLGGLDAAQHFFGLTSLQAYNLFIPDKYEMFEEQITPAHVARRIKAMLKKDFGSAVIV